MILNEQPLRGLVPLVCAATAALLTIVIGEVVLGLTPGDVSVHAPFSV